MQIIRIPKKGNVTYSLIMANTGARFENPKYKGISHFVEHMCFKGTKKRTTREIALEIEKYGGDLNAFTDWEITAYWTEITNRYKEKSLDVLKDMIRNPTFPNKEIKKERQVILQELKGHRDNSRYFVYDYLNQKLFNKNSGFYLPIIGTEKSLNNINRKELQTYHRKYYNNPIIIQVGDVSAKENYKNIIVPEYLFEVNSKNLNKSFFKVRKGITQSNVVISNYINLNIPKLDKLIAINILKAVYNDMSGRLFTVIREKHNLVYGIHFTWEMYGCGGIQWLVGLGLNANKINKAHELIIKELIRPISKKELDYTMTKLIGGRERVLDEPSSLATITAYSIVRNMDYKQLIYYYKKHYKRIAKSINEFQKMFNFKKNILVGIIPGKDKKCVS